MYDEAIASFDYAIFSDDTFTSPYIDKGKLLEKMKNMMMLLITIRKL